MFIGCPFFSIFVFYLRLPWPGSHLSTQMSSVLFFLNKPTKLECCELVSSMGLSSTSDTSFLGITPTNRPTRHPFSPKVFLVLVYFFCRNYVSRMYVSRSESKLVKVVTLTVWPSRSPTVLEVSTSPLETTWTSKIVVVRSWLAELLSGLCNCFQRVLSYFFCNVWLTWQLLRMA